MRSVKMISGGGLDFGPYQSGGFLKLWVAENNQESDANEASIRLFVLALAENQLNEAAWSAFTG
jgi:hypothetical protein